MSVCLTNGVVVVTATFRLQAASLHQANVDWMSSCLYSTRWIVIGRASRPVVGCSYVGVFPGVFPYGRHPRFRDFDPVVLLVLLGWRRIWIASLTRRVCQCGSLSMHLTSFQLGPCPVALACSATAEVWQRARRTSLSCSFILSCTGLPVSPMYKQLNIQSTFAWWRLAACSRNVAVTTMTPFVRQTDKCIL